MTKLYFYILSHQWRYDGDHRLLRILCFLQYRGSSSVVPAQECREQPTSMKAPASLIPNFDSHAYARTLQLCTKNNELKRAKIIHYDILKMGNCLDLYGRNILLNLYLKTGFLSDGLKVFEEMSDRNVSFVTMIQGYSQFKEYGRAVNLFFMVHKEGHELNPFVFIAILKLLVSMDWLELALCVHACILKLGYGSDAFVGTSLLDAYSVFGVVNFAKEVFKGIVERDMVCWTGMVSCYAENDCFEDSLDLFNQMRSAGLMPNNYTFASVIKACLGLENAELGKSIHGCVIKTCYEMDSYVGVSLLDLYTRSRDIEDARHVFEEIPKDDVVPWSFMISRYSQSDRCQHALDMFLQMRKAFVSPNEFTLASVLQACATKENLELGSQVHCHMIKVMVTPFSEIGDNEYLDPRTAQVAIVDHVNQVCRRSRPANDEELPTPYIEEHLYALDIEVTKYVSEAYPKGICSIYCVNGKDVEEPGMDFELAVVISAARLSPQNFWSCWRVGGCFAMRNSWSNFQILIAQQNLVQLRKIYFRLFESSLYCLVGKTPRCGSTCNGSWRSIWNVEFKDEAQFVEVRGTLQVGAHYFEDGNVQLDAKHECKDSTMFMSPEDCAHCVTTIIRHHETEYLNSLQTSYSKLPDATFKDLRRKLPVTRTLFPWHNTSQFSLRRDIQKSLGLEKKK